jgi:hypothetical protein
MIILGLEFLALIVICYVFLVYAMRDQVSERKLTPSKIAGVAILAVLTMILFASWYVRLGLASLQLNRATNRVFFGRIAS